MVTEVRLEQQLKVALPIVVTESGMVTEVRIEQPLKASLPIVVTESGIVIDLSFEQLASELGISTHLIMLKFNNLSNDKKKELEELYINNYSLFNSI